METSPITAAVIPVAGLGTRLLPATRSQPKEMLPVLDKPVVQYVVEELAAAGIDRVLFVTGRRKRAIEDHFDHDPELGGAAPGDGLQIMYTRQPRPAGLGDALARGLTFAAGEPVLVAVGDSIIEEDPPGALARRLIAAFTDAARQCADTAADVGVDSDADVGSGAGDGPICAAIAVAEVPDERVSRYGIVVAAPQSGGAAPQSGGAAPQSGGAAPQPGGAAPQSGGAAPQSGGVKGHMSPYPPQRAFEVADVVEKPSPSDVESRWAVMGRYVLGPSVLRELADTPADAATGEVQVADALRARLRAGERVVAVPLLGRERRHDIGTPAGYAGVFLRYALRDPRFGASMRALAVDLIDGDD